MKALSFLNASLLFFGKEFGGESQRGQANHDVNNPFNLWHRAKQKVDEIEVCSGKAADTNQAPVESSNENKDGNNHAEHFVICHVKGG